MNFDNTIDIQQLHEHTEDFVLWKTALLDEYSADPAVQQDVSDALDTLVASQEFSHEDIQQYFVQALDYIQDISLLQIPGLLRDALMKFMQTSAVVSQNTDEVEQNIDEVEQNTAIETGLDEKHQLVYKKLEFNLLALQVRYPQYVIPSIYLTENLSIFTDATIQDVDQQKTILTYKYILEQIVAEKKSRGEPLTQQEVSMITDFNSFCLDTGINTSIDISYQQEIHSMRDVLDHQNLGEHLYTHNESVKQFIDTQPSVIDTPLDHEAIVESLDELYPDIVTDIQSFLSAQNIRLPRSLDWKQLIVDGTINQNYLQPLVGSDDRSLVQGIQELIATRAEQVEIALQEQAQLRIRQQALGVCIRTVASYFDTVTINLEDFAAETLLSSDDINIVGNQLTIRGRIQGKQLTILYDMSTGQISSQDFIFANTGAVFVGDNAGNTEVLDFQGPVYADVEKRATTRHQSHMDQYVSSGTLAAIDTAYTHDLHNYLSHQSRDVLGSAIMEHTIEKNLATKKIQSLLSLGLPSTGLRTKDVQPEIWQLYTIFDKSMDRYTPDELRQLRVMIDTLTSIITSISKHPLHAQDASVDAVWAFLFHSDKLARDQSGKQVSNYSFYDFFAAMRYDTQEPYLKDVIDLHKLQNVIDAYTNKEPFPKNSASTATLYTKYTQSSGDDADDWLDTQLG